MGILAGQEVSGPTSFAFEIDRVELKFCILKPGYMREYANTIDASVSCSGHGALREQRRSVARNVYILARIRRGAFR